MRHRCEHGGGILARARRIGRTPEEILDFSASINPLGMPSEVAAAARRGLELAVHYPEESAESLRLALAKHHDLSPSRVLPGAGATELIYRLFRVLGVRQGVIVRPAFGEYARAMALAGGRVEAFDLDPAQGFALDPGRLVQAVGDEIDWVVLANPGNPTGTGLPPALVQDILQRLPQGARLLVDEAFVDFCPHRSLLPVEVDHPRLWVLRSLTKFYAIPGLRAGYLVGPSDEVARLAAAGEPWLLSTPAQEAAIACLQAESFRQQTLATLPQWRTRLADGLHRLGLETFPSEANYLLAELPVGGSARALQAALEERGILIRACGSFAPLNDRFIRLAVRTPAENRMVLNAVEDLYKERPNRCS